MKKALLVGCLFLGMTSTAHAGLFTNAGELIKHPVKSAGNVIGWAFAPINCVGAFGVAMIKPHDGAHGELISTVGCIAQNAATDPITRDGPILP